MTGDLVTIEHIGDSAVARFAPNTVLESGFVEIMARSLYAALDAKTPAKLVIDLSNVAFLSSQALGVFLTVRLKAARGRGQVRLTGVRQEFRDIFRLTKLDQMLPEYPSVEQALA